MKKKLALWLALGISLAALQACKKAEPRGIFSIYGLSGQGRTSASGSRIILLEAFVRNMGEVEGQISGIHFKISRDDTLMIEASLANYASLGLDILSLDQRVAVGGTAGVQFSPKPLFYLPAWAVYPNKVEVIFTISDSNGHEQEIHETAAFAATYDPRD